jgi:hypothetical protein
MCQGSVEIYSHVFVLKSLSKLKTAPGELVSQRHKAKHRIVTEIERKVKSLPSVWVFAVSDLNDSKEKRSRPNASVDTRRGRMGKYSLVH